MLFVISIADPFSINSSSKSYKVDTKSHFPRTDLRLFSMTVGEKKQINKREFI
jgi:hypothetical protein